MTGQGMQVRQPTKIQTVREALEQMKPQLKMALPQSITPERMMRVVMTAIQKNPQLAECEIKTLLGCVVEAAQLGLEVNDPRGLAYLIPRRNNRKEGRPLECTFLIGYQGYVQLIRNSGMVQSFNVFPVYKDDHFEEWIDENGPHFKHVPARKEQGPEDLIATYVIAGLHDGGRHYERMWRHEIDAVMARSQGASSGFSPWKTDYVAMAMKSPIRRARKYLPMATERAERISAAVARDEARELGLEPTPTIELPESVQQLLAADQANQAPVAQEAAKRDLERLRASLGTRDGETLAGQAVNGGPNLGIVDTALDSPGAPAVPAAPLGGTSGKPGREIRPDETIAVGTELTCGVCGQPVDDCTCDQGQDGGHGWDTRTGPHPRESAPGTQTRDSGGTPEGTPTVEQKVAMAQDIDALLSYGLPRKIRNALVRGGITELLQIPGNTVLSAIKGVSPAGAAEIRKAFSKWQAAESEAAEPSSDEHECPSCQCLNEVPPDRQTWECVNCGRKFVIHRV